MEGWERTSEIPTWYKSLTKGFRKFLVEGTMLDLTFHCRDGEVDAHKAIVVNASPLCNRLLRDIDEGHVHLTVDFDVESVNLMINAIYLCALPKDYRLFQKIIELAHHFELFEKDPPPVKRGPPKANVTTTTPRRAWATLIESKAPNAVVEPILRPKLCCDQLNCNCELNKDQKWEILNLKKQNKQNLVAIREEQCAICTECSKPAIMHRKAVGAFNEIQDLSVTTYEKRFAYVCCVKGCEIDKPCRTAKGFKPAHEA